MALLFKIEPSNWLGEMSWLQADDLQGDVLQDFRISNGDLSMFKMLATLNEDRIATALAANRTILTDFGYVICQEDELADRGFEIRESAGHTHDNDVNQCHVNLRGLTTDRVSELAKYIGNRIKNDTAGNVRQITKTKVKELIFGAITNGWISAESLRPELAYALNIREHPPCPEWCK